MPELPDIVVYVEAIEKRILGKALLGVRLGTPFLLRTAVPPIATVNGKRVQRVWRIGKRIAISLEDEFTLVLHLMIAGRLHWREPNAKVGGKNALAAFDFENGSLVLTEAGTKRRASLHLMAGDRAAADLDAGGLEVLGTSVEAFAKVLRAENHTLKRALTDPRLFSGIGNAYSDEILWHAQMSPVTLTSKLTDDQVEALHAAVEVTLAMWTARLREEAGDAFPEKVTAFRTDMAVHGRYEKPCPRCGSPIQRIRYAENETNYCVTCQTGGKLVSDRALSRLLGSDWPKSLDALEQLTSSRRV